MVHGSPTREALQISEGLVSYGDWWWPPAVSSIRTPC